MAGHYPKRVYIKDMNEHVETFNPMAFRGTIWIYNSRPYVEICRNNATPQPVVCIIATCWWKNGGGTSLDIPMDRLVATNNKRLDVDPNPSYIRTL